MSDPSDDDIVQVMEITGLTGERDLVVSALKVKSKLDKLYSAVAPLDLTVL